LKYLNEWISKGYFFRKYFAELKWNFKIWIIFISTFFYLSLFLFLFFFFFFFFKKKSRQKQILHQTNQFQKRFLLQFLQSTLKGQNQLHSHHHQSHLNTSKCQKQIVRNLKIIIITIIIIILIIVVHQLHIKEFNYYQQVGERKKEREMKFLIWFLLFYCSTWSWGFEKAKSKISKRTH